jgi:hypothetical protein
VVLERDFAAEIAREPGVWSDMGRVEPTPAPEAPSTDSPDGAILLDIAASDAALQDAAPTAVADMHAVVSREEIALDRAMAQAYVFAFAFNGDEAPPPVAEEPSATSEIGDGALPVEPVALLDAVPAGNEVSDASPAASHRNVTIAATLLVGGATVIARRQLAKTKDAKRAFPGS